MLPIRANVSEHLGEDQISMGFTGQFLPTVYVQATAASGTKQPSEPLRSFAPASGPLPRLRLRACGLPVTSAAAFCSYALCLRSYGTTTRWHRRNRQGQWRTSSDSAHLAQRDSFPEPVGIFSGREVYDLDVVKAWKEKEHPDFGEAIERLPLIRVDSTYPIFSPNPFICAKFYSWQSPQHLTDSLMSAQKRASSPTAVPLAAHPRWLARPRSVLHRLHTGRPRRVHQCLLKRRDPDFPACRPGRLPYAGWLSLRGPRSEKPDRPRALRLRLVERPSMSILSDILEDNSRSSDSPSTSCMTADPSTPSAASR